MKYEFASSAGKADRNRTRRLRKPSGATINRLEARFRTVAIILQRCRIQVRMRTRFTGHSGWARPERITSPGRTWIRSCGVNLSDNHTATRSDDRRPRTSRPVGPDRVLRRPQNSMGGAPGRHAQSDKGFHDQQVGKMLNRPRALTPTNDRNTRPNQLYGVAPALGDHRGREQGCGHAAGR